METRKYKILETHAQMKDKYKNTNTHIYMDNKCTLALNISGMTVSLRCAQQSDGLLSQSVD